MDDILMTKVMTFYIVVELAVWKMVLCVCEYVFHTKLSSFLT